VRYLERLIWFVRSEVDVLFDGLFFSGLVLFLGHELVGVTHLGRRLHVGNVDHVGHEVRVDVVLGNCLSSKHEHQLNGQLIQLVE